VLWFASPVKVMARMPEGFVRRAGGPLGIGRREEGAGDHTPDCGGGLAQVELLPHGSVALQVRVAVKVWLQIAIGDRVHDCDGEIDGR